MRLFIDFETKDNYIGRGLGAGWAYACNLKEHDFKVLGAAVMVDGSTDYITDHKNILALARKAKSFICHNASYDVGCLMALGMSLDEIYNKRIFDTKLAAKLFDSSHMSYSLDNLSKLYLDVSKDSDGLGNAAYEEDLYPWLKRELAAKKRAEKAGVEFVRPKPPQAKLNKWAITNMDIMQEHCLDVVAKYAIRDVLNTAGLFKIFYGLKKQDNRIQLFKLVDKLIKLSLKMRLRGVNVDLNRCREVHSELTLNKKIKIKELEDMAGQSVDLWSNNSIAEAATKLGIKFPTTSLGNPSFTKSWMADQTDPFFALLNDARKLDKIDRDFVLKLIDLQEYTCPGATDVGKVYPEWNIFGAQTGRFSCANPNMQQIPKRDKYLGPLCRSLFIPDKGKKMFALDYSNQEGRLQVHFAFERRCEGSDMLVSKFMQDPNLDMHQEVADLAKISRSDAKAINLGLSYGMGLEKLASQLGLENEEEAKELRTKYLEMAPYLRSIIHKTKMTARKHKYITTLGGRRVTVQEDEDYKAFNKLIQGSAGDQTLKAMVLADAAGIEIILTVHDELVIQGSESDARKCRSIMETAIPLALPVVVDFNKSGGSNWNEA